MKKTFLTALAAFAVFSFATPAFSAEVKIAHTNLQKALNDCAAGIKAKESLQEEAKKLEAQLNSKQEELKKLKDEIEKKSSLWNKDTREQKEKEFRAKSQEFKEQYMKYNEDLQKKKVSTEAMIIEELKDIVEDIAKKKGYTYVFERSIGGVLVAPADADLTDEVIKAHNSKKGKGK